MVWRPARLLHWCWRLCGGPADLFAEKCCRTAGGFARAHTCPGSCEPALVAFTRVVSLPVEGLRLFARSHTSEERFRVAWHAGIQAGKFSQGQLDYLDRVQKLCFAGRRLQNHFWVLVSGEEPGIYDRWGDVRRRLHGGCSGLCCAWPSIAEASAYGQGALLAKRRRPSGE